MPLAGLLVTWVVARFKSVPGVVARTVATVLFCWLDMASDVYTINTLFGLGHNGAASVLNVALQVVFLRRCAASLPAPLGEASKRIGLIGCWGSNLGLARRRFLRS
jgi:hypothetical protein